MATHINNFDTGEALNLDLQDFYTEIYRLLLPLSLDPDIEKTPISQNVDDDNNETKNHQAKLETEAELVIKSLELMFVKKRHVRLGFFSTLSYYRF